MKQGHRRKASQVERDRKEISRLYLRGDYQSEIAERLGLSQQTISNDLKVIQEQWKVERVDDINEKKNIELAKIDALEVEYWKAWKESQEDEKTQTLKRKGVIIQSEDGKEERITPVETVTNVKGQSGNPAFLRGVEWCINKRCDILGLEAPKKHDIKSDGEKIGQTDEQLDRAMSTLADALRESVLGESEERESPVDTAE